MMRNSVDPCDTGVPAPGREAFSDVQAWRRRRLADAGFPGHLALELAMTPGIDLHALLALVDRGCPPELAARILAPLEAEVVRP